MGALSAGACTAAGHAHKAAFTFVDLAAAANQEC